MFESCRDRQFFTASRASRGQVGGNDAGTDRVDRDLRPSIQGDRLRVSAHVRRWIERLSIDRPVPILTPERISGRKGVIGELAISRKDFGPGIQPGALGYVDAGMRL